jgi:Tfp pilus assembly protein PilF
MWLQRFTETRILRIAALLSLAVALAACGSTPATQKNSSKAQISRGPDGTPLPRDIPPKAMTMFEQAVAVMAAGDAIDAELRFQDFLLQFPDYPAAHVNLAIIFAERGDDTAAEGSLTDALILDPVFPPALNQLGMLLRRQGKFPEAQDAYLKAVAADPDYALAHYNLGVLNELYLQRLDVALQHFESYQALSSDDKQVTKWIADLKRRISRNQRAANVTE